MRVFCVSTLIGEFFVVGFAGLVAMKDPDLTAATVWTVCGAAMLLSLVLCGMISRPGGLQLGWVLQAALVASGFVVPVMFFLGAAFAGLWWASIHFGRKVDEAKAAYAAQAEEPEEPEETEEAAPGGEAEEATQEAAGSTEVAGAAEGAAGAESPRTSDSL